MALGHSVPHWASEPPEHEWYVVLDVNFRGIPIRAPWWPRAATLLDQVHWPAPGIRIRPGRVALGMF